MKIALAQLNYITGDFEGNAGKITENIEKAKSSGADLVVFSELSVTGYFPYDLLERKDFIVNTEKTVKKIAESCSGIAAVIGATFSDKNKNSEILYNSAFFLADGKVMSVHNKTKLNSSGIFNESIYFKSAINFKTVKYKDECFAITIGNNFPGKQFETIDFAVNISASLFSHNIENLNKKELRGISEKYKIPVVNVNQTGTQTGLIFEGGSVFINEHGNIVKELKYFEEDFIVVDTKNPGETELQPQVGYIEKIYDALVAGIKNYFEKAGFKQAVLGLSGGLDSAVATVLAADALGSENVNVLLLPSKYSSEHSVKDAVELAENLKIKYDILNIQNAVDTFEKELFHLFKGTEPDVTEENIQARARGVYLMAVSNKFGSVLLNSTNKSEYAVGYGTLYGDMNGGLSVLGDVYKTDVYKLARFINRTEEIIPENIIAKPPSAELRPNQKDSDSLPEYEILDSVLYCLIEQNFSVEEVTERGFDAGIVKKIVKMINSSEYKRYQASPVLRVSSKSLVADRKMPF